MVTSKAAVIRDKGGHFKVEDVELEAPRADEVLVRTVATGVCHTDMIVRDQILPPGPPAILGHEGAGVVEAVGSGVASVAVGDAVVLAPVSCSRCRNCVTGHPMHCDNFQPLNFGGRRADGTTAYKDETGAELNAHFFGQSSFSNHIVANERAVVKVPAEAPLELLGPLGCGVQTGAGSVLNGLTPEAGSSIAIFGAGGVGMAAVMGAVIAGCDPIIAVDLHAERLDTATELGATHCVNASASDVADQIHGIAPGGADFALDTVGLPQTLRNAVDVLNIGGVAGLVGAGAVGQEVSIGLVHLLFGRTVKGIIEGDSVPQVFIPKLIDFYLSGRLPLDKLVKKYAFEEINAAVEDSENGRAIKPVLVY